MGLRRGEAVGLDVADLDVPGGRLSLIGKHRTQAEWLTVPDPTLAALGDWLRVRGPAAGPVFVRLDVGTAGLRRLSGESVRQIVRALAGRAGLARPVRPHGLRHAAITQALDLTNGNVRAVSRYSRHKDVRVLSRYDDNRSDLAGAIATLVAETLDAGISAPKGGRARSGAKA
jgi:integrase/recombinase XerC